MRLVVVTLVAYVVDSFVFRTLLPVAPPLLVWVVAITLLGTNILAAEIIRRMDLSRD